MWNTASCEALFAAPGRGRLDGEAETARAQHRGQAVERWIAGLREHAIEAFTVQPSISRQGAESATGIGDITKSQKKHAGVVLLKASVQIVSTPSSISAQLRYPRPAIRRTKGEFGNCLLARAAWSGCALSTTLSESRRLPSIHEENLNSRATALFPIALVLFAEERRHLHPLAGTGTHPDPGGRRESSALARRAAIPAAVPRPSH